MERFLQKTVKRDGGCWEWVGGRKAAGYGQFAVDGKKVIAHRWSYRTFVGEIPDGYEIDHLCNNPPCVNPEHLEAITLQENRYRRNARKTHCVNGHEYMPENTMTYTARDGYTSRYCIACRRAVAKRRAA